MFTAANAINEAAFGARPPFELIKAATPALVAGRPHSLAYLTGVPGAMAAPAPGLAGAALTAYAGQLPFDNPAGGMETRLMRFQAHCNQPGTLLLCDRLWHNSGLVLTATTAQAINSVAFPARDADGLALGRQVMLGLEVSSLTGAGTPTLTASYTDFGGVAGRIATNVVPTVAGSAQGAFYPLGWATGAGQGVASVQNFTFSATWTSGAAHLVAYRVLARLEVSASNPSAVIDFLTGGAVKQYDNSVRFAIFIPSGTGAMSISGHVIDTQA